MNFEADAEGNIDSIALRDRIIEKRGYVIEFSLGTLEDNVLFNSKNQKELQAKIVHEQAKAENILHFNEFLSDLTEEQRHACWMYMEASQMADVAAIKLDQINTQIELDNEEITEIKSQIPALADNVDPTDDEIGKDSE